MHRTNINVNKTSIEQDVLEIKREISKIKLSEDDILEIKKYIKRVETGIESEALTHWGNHCDYTRGW